MVTLEIIITEEEEVLEEVTEILRLMVIEINSQIILQTTILFKESSRKK